MLIRWETYRLLVCHDNQDGDTKVPEEYRIYYTALLVNEYIGTLGQDCDSEV